MSSSLCLPFLTFFYIFLNQPLVASEVGNESKWLLVKKQPLVFFFIKLNYLFLFNYAKVENILLSLVINKSARDSFACHGLNVALTMVSELAVPVPQHQESKLNRQVLILKSEWN